MAKILAFSGSLRSAGFNQKLVRLCAHGARDAGANVTEIELKDFPMPVFDEDSEAKQGLHPNARKLKDLFLAHQGFLIASPEYNSSVTAALKNAIDWVSRPAPGERSLECFSGKVAGIMGASPGGLGGIRGLVHLRSILGNIGVLVLPEQVTVAAAHEAFDEKGGLKDKNKADQVTALGRRVAEVTTRLFG